MQALNILFEYSFILMTSVVLLILFCKLVAAHVITHCTLVVVLAFIQAACPACKVHNVTQVLLHIAPFVANRSTEPANSDLARHIGRLRSRERDDLNADLADKSLFRILQRLHCLSQGDLR